MQSFNNQRHPNNSNQDSPRQGDNLFLSDHNRSGELSRALMGHTDQSVSSQASQQSQDLPNSNQNQQNARTLVNAQHQSRFIQAPQMVLETGSLSYQRSLNSQSSKFNSNSAGSNQENRPNYSRVNSPLDNSNSEGSVNPDNQPNFLTDSQKEAKKMEKNNEISNTISNPKIQSSSDSSDENRLRDRRRLFVGGITGRTKMEKIQILFSKFGEIVEIKRPRNQKGAFRGFCFIEFAEENSVTKALESGNLWHNDRLLSLRKLKSSPQLANNADTKNEHRITIYGFPGVLNKELKTDLQNYFSILGQLEYYYYMYVRIDKIENDDIQRYIKVNNLQTEKYQKIHILNISYKDANISKNLLDSGRLNIGGSIYKVSHYTRKLKQEEVEAKNQKNSEQAAAPPNQPPKFQSKSSLVLKGYKPISISPNSIGRMSDSRIPHFGYNPQVTDQGFYSPQYFSKPLITQGKYPSAPLPYVQQAHHHQDPIFKINSMDCLGLLRRHPQSLRNFNAQSNPQEQVNSQPNVEDRALASYLAQKSILQRQKILLEIVVSYDNFNHNSSNLKFNHSFFSQRKH